ncbi:sialic acid-binding Ig-like lectin 12 isoform X2 [Gymnodraco acuticeps]|uniref:Sialic acid-binding Ig-like lectin 12 isoform X2 n=1 Tax=Gymnodraco acuticeps TaxID=8218 RepID=A0A6P8TUI7_GYMAC|nr:sialic acid-binding Ig-like lectin 12 isoform X2 [Gymnodraco acuticeps]
MAAIMLLGVFFVSGKLFPHCKDNICALASCPEHAQPLVTTPQEMEALSGSCLQIPCNFSINAEETFDRTGPTSGLWIKSDYYYIFGSKVVFNGNMMENIYPMSLTGDLSQNDCSTLFSSVITSYTGSYLFRIDNRRRMETCDPLQIKVKDSPPSPTIEIPGDLKEAESVTVTCSAPAPCPHSPPKLTWTLQQDPPNTMEENPDRTFTTKIQKTLILTDQHDGFNITCSASYPVNQGKDVKTAEETKTLHVSYAPKDVTVVVSPADPVSVGSVVNLTCSCRGIRAADGFAWLMMMSDGRLHTMGDNTQLYVFEVTNSDRGRSYFCGCSNVLGLQLSKGRALIFEGDHETVDGHLILKMLGIIMLVSTLVIFECWFRSRRSSKPEKDAAEAEYLNRVTNILSHKEEGRRSVHFY